MNAHWPLNETFRLRLTMLSDWHVGSGAGRPGNVDRLIVRDADGLPFAPAKTLRGIWRDACERLGRGLDEGRTGDWSRLVDRLFGSQPALDNFCHFSSLESLTTTVDGSRKMGREPGRLSHERSLHTGEHLGARLREEGTPHETP